MNKKHLLASLCLVALAVLGRLMPHLWNATPLGAVAIFSAAYLGLRYAIPIVLASALISDIAIGLYDWRIMALVYISLVASACLGAFSSRPKTPLKVAVAAIGSSALFFAISNYGVWQFGSMYPHTISGLMASYAAALPFFRNSLVGDSMYALALFGGYELFRYAKGSFAAKRLHIREA